MLAIPSSTSWLPLLPSLSSDLLSYPYPAPCATQALKGAFLPLLPLPHAPEEPLYIVTGKTSDLSAIQDLHARSFPLHFEPAFFFTVLLQDSFITLVAKAGDVLLGCLTARVDQSKREVHILTLCVDSTARRKGIAVTLLSSLAERLAASSNPPRLAILHVQGTNAPAISLYTRLGFVTRTRKPVHYRGTKYGGNAACEMVKQL